MSENHLKSNATHILPLNLGDTDDEGEIAKDWRRNHNATERKIYIFR